MPKTRFIRKPLPEELKPRDEFVIDVVVEISLEEMNKFEHRPLDSYEFISNHSEVMHIDENNVWHCIFLTSKEIDYGYLINSEGFKYARYLAYIDKKDIV